MPTGTRASRRSEDDRADDETVTLFGSWRAAYTAVIVSALLLMVLVGVFSRWPY